jgi:hypothetical protein
MRNCVVWVQTWIAFRTDTNSNVQRCSADTGIGERGEKIAGSNSSSYCCCTTDRQHVSEHRNSTGPWERWGTNDGIIHSHKNLLGPTPPTNDHLSLRLCPILSLSSSTSRPDIMSGASLYRLGCPWSDILGSDAPPTIYSCGLVVGGASIVGRL